MRVFIAADIGQKVRQALGKLQSELQRRTGLTGGEVKWVDPNNIHLTLKFLGHASDKQIIDVCQATELVAGRQSSFELEITSVGCFGGKTPRVLWVGTGTGSNDLKDLQSALEAQLQQVGWEREKRDFAAHLTLCRIKKPGTAKRLASEAKHLANRKVGSIWVDTITVYNSDLRPSGPIYTALARYHLK